MNKKNPTGLIWLDFSAHLAVYILTFVSVQQTLQLPFMEAYQQFQTLSVQPPVTFAAIFGLLHVVAQKLPKQNFAMLDYVIDVGMIVIPLLSSVVAVVVAAQAGFWYMWVVAILASVVHLFVKTQLPPRTAAQQAPAATNFVSLAAIAYVGSYAWLALTYLLQ